ncbi:MAG: hypothetical protein WD118_01440 [Phycisphaeraceae bacterium]
MGDFKRRQAGERLTIRASEWNQLGDLVRQHQRGDGKPPPKSGFTGPDTTVVTIRNTTGGDLDRFAVVGLDGPLISPDDNEAEFQTQPRFTGVTPTLDHVGRFAVLLEPAAANALARAAVAGVTVARVHLTDPAKEHHAGIEPDESGHLVATPTGTARILWAEDGESAEVRWAIVRLGDGPSIGFWARITGTDSEDDALHTFVEIDAEGEDLTDGRAGEAAEANGREGVPTDTIVFVQQVGFDATASEPIYRFEKDQGDQGDSGSSSAKDLAEDSDESSSAAPSPRSDDWDRADQGSDRGVETSRLTRSHLERSVQEGDEHLVRKLTLYGETELHEADGHLQEVSDERKVLDALEVWPPVVAIDHADTPGFLEDKLHTDDSVPGAAADTWLERDREAGAVGDRFVVKHKQPQSEQTQLQLEGDAHLIPNDGEFSRASFDFTGHFRDLASGQKLIGYTHGPPLGSSSRNITVTTSGAASGGGTMNVDDNGHAEGNQTINIHVPEPSDPTYGVEVDLLREASYDSSAKEVHATPRRVKVLEDLGDQIEQTVLTPANLADMLKELPGYDAGKQQALTHDGGTVQWMDIDDCA